MRSKGKQYSSVYHLVFPGDKKVPSTSSSKQRVPLITGSTYTQEWDKGGDSDMQQLLA